jgi:RNA polymerase sigma-70 factor (ECF subfamily)
LTPEESALLAGLLARCAMRDERAAAELYRACAPKLFAVIARILRRGDWAEEVLQETYLSIWRHAGEYRPDLSAPLTWMTRIARNRALDWLRRPREESLGEEYQPMVERLTDETPDLIERLSVAAEAEALTRCLSALDANSRHAIALAYYHGLTHSEAAAHLGHPLGTVKTWIRRGLAELRLCLERT